MIDKLIDCVLEYKEEVMLWGDIALQYREFIPKLPPQAILLNWDYCSNPDEYKIRTVAELGCRQYICPCAQGDQGFEDIIGDINSAFSNITGAVGYAVKYKTEGVLITYWGDIGHVYTIGAAMPALVYGAGLMWTPPAQDAASFDTAALDELVSRMLYGNPFIIGLMKQMPRIEKIKWSRIAYWYYDRVGEITESEREEYGEYYDIMPMLPSFSSKELKEAITGIEVILSEMRTLTPKIHESARDDINEIINSMSLYSLTLRFVLALKNELSSAEKSSLAMDFESQSALLAKLWRKRNKESDLSDVLTALDVIADRLRAGQI